MLNILRHIVLLLGGLVGGFALLGVMMWRIGKKKYDLASVRYDPVLVILSIGIFAIVAAVVEFW
jgi:hypothetical protein